LDRRKKDKKRLATIEIKFFRKTEPGTPFFYYKRNEGILSELKAEQVDKKLRRYKQINLSTSYNKNEQQQNVKNNAEL
jgi:hypothetical protein